MIDTATETPAQIQETENPFVFSVDEFNRIKEDPNQLNIILDKKLEDAGIVDKKAILSSHMDQLTKRLNDPKMNNTDVNILLKEIFTTMKFQNRADERARSNAA